MKQISKVSILLIFALFTTVVLGAETNPDWNYASNGDDWSDIGPTYAKCTSTYAVESPVDYSYDWSTLGGYFLYNWAGDGFSFLPQLSSSPVTTYGFENWVYQMSDFTNIGGWYAAEPLSSPQNHQLYWDVTGIRFHYPAEHKVNGTIYDVEMQIFGNDFYSRHVTCFSGVGATSIFFMVDPANPDVGNPFFDWQADATAGNPVTIDLNTALPKTTSATNNIYGYSGTDTMPTCQPVCWYAVETPLGISQAQADFFKLTYEEVTYPSNARTTGLGVTTYTTYFFWYGAFAPIPTPIVVPPGAPTEAAADL